MPVYDYACAECGPFTAFAALADYRAPCACPDCAADAPRILLTAPRLAGMDGARRHAHATNERSADTPRRSSHGPRCGCCGGGAKTAGSKTLVRPDGSKSFPSKRPWMISH